jgi:hypothetical protein
MKDLLEKDTLKELYLHWNFLKSTFAKIILPTLNNNDHLKVLDLSNNSIGANIN